MVEIYKLAVRKCGESARARLALEKKWYSKKFLRLTFLKNCYKDK